jgi:hypothetical protein
MITKMASLSKSVPAASPTAPPTEAEKRLKRLCEEEQVTETPESQEGELDQEETMSVTLAPIPFSRGP